MNSATSRRPAEHGSSAPAPCATGRPVLPSRSPLHCRPPLSRPVPEQILERGALASACRGTAGGLRHPRVSLAKLGSCDPDLACLHLPQLRYAPRRSLAVVEGSPAHVLDRRARDRFRGVAAARIASDAWRSTRPSG
jgi:hypothetical protein